MLFLNLALSLSLSLALMIADSVRQENTFRHEAIEKMTKQLASLHRTIDGRLPNYPL